MHLFADLEEGHALVFDANSFAGAWVAAGAGFALFYGESAEAAQLNARKSSKIPKLRQAREREWLFTSSPQ